MRRYISILIVAISIAATSCNNFLVKEPVSQEGEAYVTLAVGKTGSRTILPESYDEVSALKDFVFTATSEDHEPITQTFANYDSLQTAQLFFTPGIYDCRLSVTSTAGVKYERVLEDTVISPGDNVLSFNLQVVQLSADPGSLEVQLTFPRENVQMVKAGLYSIAGEALAGFPEDVLAISGGNTVTYSKDRVPGGSYVIQFSFYGDAECTVFLGMHTEVIVIVSGKKSAATRSIESINQMYTITYELDGGSFVEGYTPPRKFIPNMELQLPKVSEVQKPGEGLSKWDFSGWYEDVSFAGSPVDSLSRGTGENKTYYARWDPYIGVDATTVSTLDFSGMTGECKVVVTDEINESTISTLKSKLTTAGTSAKIHLDLSQTTGLTSIGERAFDGCSGLTSMEIPASVTSIGRSAFSGCSGLTSVEIPASVTSIGEHAFYGCSGLTVYYQGELARWCEGDWTYLMYFCDILYINGELVQGDLVIPPGVTSIGGGAFYGCSGLTSVEIPASVTSIDDEAFEGCSGLTSVEIPAGVVDSGSFGLLSAVTGECRVALTGEIDEINNLALSFFSAARESIKIHLDLSQTTGLTSIGDSAFWSCDGLTSVEIPASVTSIGEAAFVGCSGLTSVTFGEGSRLESIGESAFSGCSGLTSVEIPASVTSIGRSAFDGCSGLTSVEIPAGVTSIGSRAFSSCSGLTSVEIPAGVTSIGHNAFYWCSGLTSVEIPASVTSIGMDAFDGCSGLTSVTFGEDSRLKSIGEGAFSGCSGLTSVEIPASVTSIGKFAFSVCSGLTSVTFGDTSGWYVTTSETGAANKTGGTAVTLSSRDLAANADLVRDSWDYWYKVD